MKKTTEKTKSGWMKAKTYKQEWEAVTAMRQINHTYRLAGNKKDLCVMVEGPEIGEWTLMDIREAIKNEFFYSWEI